jgi:DNA-binding SARP family transcriptional activator
MSFSIRLLGAFELRSGDHVAIDGSWRPEKAAALVKILALQRGRTMHRDQLIDVLWPEADAEAGRSSFYKNLHHLRKAIRAVGDPDPIVLNRGVVSLDSDVQVDVDVFRELGRRALRSGDIGLLEQSLAGYGELLPADLYEPWAAAHRDEVGALGQRLRLELADRYLQRGRIDDASLQYREVLATNAASEDAHRGLMRAYGTNGQRELALRQYERCKELLATELAATPSRETEALASEIRSLHRLTNRVDQAIGEPTREGDAAMRRFAWSEAIEHYRTAIERLQATDRDDVRECELWLKLAEATSAVGTTLDVAEHCRRAVALAERAEAFDLRARALVRFQDATDSVPGNHAGHREAADLIRSALAQAPAEAAEGRALLLAASARPLSAEARPENERHITGRLSVAGSQNVEIGRRLREAVVIARDVGKPDVLAYTLSRLRVYITSPDTLGERLDLTREMMDLYTTVRHPLAEFDARLFRHEDLLESGDLDGARIEARAIRRIGEAMHTDVIVGVAGSLAATHATADGALREGKRLLFESHGLDARRGDNSNSLQRFGVQLLMLRWHEGRISEMYEPYRRAVDGLPRVMGIRATLALILAETGRIEEAREELRLLSKHSPADIPKDYLWWLTTVCMSLVAVATDAPQVATDLYALLLPYAGRNASTAGAVSFGSASLTLGQLAAFLRQFTQAEQHFSDALAFNIQTRQRVWTARTRFHYAEMLRTRGHAHDVLHTRELVRVALADAQEIGMVDLEAKLSALRLS